MNPEVTEPREGDRVEVAFRSYVRARHTVAEALRETRSALGDGPGGRSCDELLSRLAEDHFEVVILGRSESDKSALVNAILERELLSTGKAQPMRGVTLRYGRRERVLVRRGERTMPEELPVPMLEELRMERRTPESVKVLPSVEVELPASFLRRAVCLIDPPGLGWIQGGGMTDLAACVERADAVLFVIGAESLLTGDDLDFLDTFRDRWSCVFVVLGLDPSAPTHHSRTIASVRGVLADGLGWEGARIFPLWPRGALAAQSSHDARALEESGLPALEEALATFLNGARRREFLATMVDRAQDLAKAAEATVHQPGRMLDRDVLSARLAHLRDAVVDETAEAADVAWLAGGSGQVVPQPSEPPRSTPDSRPVAAPDRRVGAAACQVCVAILDELLDLLREQQYHLATDPAEQSAFAAAGGWCAPHSWQLAQISSPRGLCAGYPGLLERTAERLRSLVGLSGIVAGRRILEGLPGQNICTACGVRKRAEQDALDRLNRMLSAAPSLDNLPALCLRHLGSLLVFLEQPIAAVLLEHHALRMIEVTEAMQGYALKLDARRRDLIAREEEDAHFEAVVALVGNERAIDK